jgi:hypothetical protein
MESRKPCYVNDLVSRNSGDGKHLLGVGSPQTG